MEEVKVAREELKKYAGKWIGSDDLVNLSLSQKKNEHCNCCEKITKRHIREFSKKFIAKAF